MPRQYLFNPAKHVAFGVEWEGVRDEYVAHLYHDLTITQVRFARELPVGYFYRVDTIRSADGAFYDYYARAKNAAIAETALYSRDSVQVEQECADCSGLVDPLVWGRYKNLSDEHICQECNRTYKCCQHCGDRSHEDDMTSAPNGYSYCNSCYSTLLTECTHCGSDLWRDDAMTVEGDSYCASCYNRYFFTCDSCSNTMRNSARDDDHPSLCVACACENEVDEDRDPDEEYDSIGVLIHGYSYKPAPIFHGLGLHVGVELETQSSRNVNGDARRTLDALNGSGVSERHAYLKKDGSIGDNGFEIVTHPHTMEEQRKLWEPFFARKPIGMTSYKSGECGMHVHIERRHLTNMQTRRMLVFVNEPRNLQYIAAIAQRGSSTYARLAKKKITDPLYSYDRYEAINLTDKTAELRIFRGTVRKERFYKNLEFTEAMITFCKVTTLERLTATEFLEYVKKNRSKWKYLHNFHIERGFYSGKPLPVSKPKQVAVAA